jgi:hypothetical protein
VENEASWREQLRDVLLRELIEELGATGVRAVGGDRVYDDLSDALRDLYSTQARLLGVPADQYVAAQTPAELLRVIIQSCGERLNDSPPRGVNTALLDEAADWRQQLEAIHYAAEDDIHRTVLLQRLWFRILAARLANEGDVLLEQIDTIAQQLTQEDRRAADAFGQLQAAERALLDVWLLRRPL